MIETAKKRYQLFFKDLIVLAKETYFVYENNLNVELVYEILLNGEKNKFYRFKYDIKIKKWLLISHKSKEFIIFNPKIIEGIKQFLEIFTLEDLKTSHEKMENIYNNLKQ